MTSMRTLLGLLPVLALANAGAAQSPRRLATCS
jgi:hypothetical protein